MSIFLSHRSHGVRDPEERARRGTAPSRSVAGPRRALGRRTGACSAPRKQPRRAPGRGASAPAPAEAGAASALLAPAVSGDAAQSRMQPAPELHPQGAAGAVTLPEAPVFTPTADEFQDPLAYIASIRAVAQDFGACKIVPPAGWRGRRQRGVRPRKAQRPARPATPAWATASSFYNAASCPYSLGTKIMSPCCSIRYEMSSFLCFLQFCSFYIHKYYTY